MRYIIVFACFSFGAMGCAPVQIPRAFTPTDAPSRAPASAEPPRVATSAPTRAGTLAGTMTVKLFFVALDDNGKSGKKIGCNDSLVAVERTIPTTIAPLSVTLRELLAIRETRYGQSGLYNALAESNLKIESVALVGDKAEIQLTGALKLGGVCDNPRVQAQLEATALQFATIKRVAIAIHGTPLEILLSGK